MWREDSGVGLAPKTEFVLRADSHLAYQVFGSGNAKVLMLYGVPSHLDYFWEFSDSGAGA